MQEIFELIREISDSDAAVLIQGESGTGKEMLANAIQATSKRNNKPFVKVNCAVFPVIEHGSCLLDTRIAIEKAVCLIFVRKCEFGKG